MQMETLQSLNQLFAYAKKRARDQNKIRRMDSVQKYVSKYISKYFNGECGSLQDSEYHGSSWRMKFTFSHRERAISIQEMLNNTHRPFGVLLTPHFEHNIVMKKVSFERARRETDRPALGGSAANSR